jgi:hypothetical protein
MGNGGDGTGQTDFRNNNEKIIINNPGAGKWLIVVVTNSLPGGSAPSEEYGIVVTCGGYVDKPAPGDTDDFL